MSNYLEQGKTFLEKKEYSKAMEFFQAAIEKEINNVPNGKVREILKNNLKEIENGNRDFRF